MMAMLAASSTAIFPRINCHFKNAMTIRLEFFRRLLHTLPQ